MSAGLKKMIFAAYLLINKSSLAAGREPDESGFISRKEECQCYDDL
jgi:hypothetical protein